MRGCLSASFVDREDISVSPTNRSEGWVTKFIDASRHSGEGSHGIIIGTNHICSSTHGFAMLDAFGRRAVWGEPSQTREIHRFMNYIGSFRVSVSKKRRSMYIECTISYYGSGMSQVLY